MLTVEPDAQLDLRGIITRFPDKLGDLGPAPDVISLLSGCGGSVAIVGSDTRVRSWPVTCWGGQAGWS